MGSFENIVKMTDKRAQYDACAKLILSHKSILSRIVKDTIPEYKDMDPDEIAKCIEGTPFVSNVRIEPGLTNPSISNVISGINVENAVPGEGDNTFDIMFYLRTPDGLTQIIVNIEAQRRKKPGYPLGNRIIYYGCRQVSSQKEREFVHSNYGDIKKVYSIWLCFNLDQDCMNLVHLVNDPVLGDHQWDIDLGLLSFVLVGLKKENADTDYKELNTKLHQMLRIVFAMELSSDERMELLEKKVEIPRDADLEKEMDYMCNLSYDIEEKGYENGLKSAIQKMLLKNMPKKEIKYYLDVTDRQIEEAEEELCVK